MFCKYSDGWEEKIYLFFYEIWLRRTNRWVNVDLDKNLKKKYDKMDENAKIWSLCRVIMNMVHD